MGDKKPRILVVEVESPGDGGELCVCEEFGYQPITLVDTAAH